MYNPAYDDDRGDLPHLKLLDGSTMPKTSSVNIDASEAPLLVASTGGHLQELFLWAQRWRLLGGGASWVTFESEQSRSLLRGEDVSYVPYVAPRDLGGAIRAAKLIFGVVSQRSPKVVVSTGSAVAVSAAVAALSLGVRFVYIESLARREGLSLTGRILQNLPRVERYVQNPELCARGFRFGGSILQQFDVIDQSRYAAAPKSVFVSLGTIKPYAFDRAVDSLSSILVDYDVTWQIGEHTKKPDFGEVHTLMTMPAVENAISTADVVITHAGVGSILTSLRLGKKPIVLPRRASFSEHVDDHQIEIAEMLHSEGLVHYVQDRPLNASDLKAVAAAQVTLQRLG